MLKTRMKRQVAMSEQAMARLAAIVASIKALPDEDLLDLADIFSAETQSPLWALASAEMLKRNLSL